MALKGHRIWALFLLGGCRVSRGDVLFLNRQARDIIITFISTIDMLYPNKVNLLFCLFRLLVIIQPYILQ